MARETLLTQKGLDKLKAELKELKEQRKVIAERIKIAREYGDLSENSEYDDARNEQSFVEGKIQELQEMIKNAKVVANTGSSDNVQMGSVATLKCDGETVTYEIVGANESDPGRGKISAESPLGFSLLGKAKGEKIEIKTPNGVTGYEIIEVK